MSHSSSQTFLRGLDKKLWTAADKLPPGTEIKESGRLAHPYKITSTGKLIDDALEAVEKENPKLKNVPVASVCDRPTLNYRNARRKPHDFEPNRRRPKPRKTSDDPFRTTPLSSFGIRNSAFDILQLHHLAPNGSMALLLSNGSMRPYEPTGPSRKSYSPAVKQKSRLDASEFFN